MAVNPLMESARSTAGVRSAGVEGIRAGLKGMEQAAQQMAELSAGPLPAGPLPAAPAATEGAAAGRTGGPEDAVEALLELRVHQRQVQASAKVVESADAVLGFLLDIHA